MPPGVPVMYKRLQNLDVWVKRLHVDGTIFAPGEITEIDGDLTITGSLTIDGGFQTTGFVEVGGRFQVSGNQAVTATADGLTTGLITAGESYVTVTSANAAHQISLPAAQPGWRTRIKTGGTGCELISQVITDKVNTVLVGATNELALVANALFDCQYVGNDNWIVTGVTDLGAAIATLVPDAL